MGRRFRLLVVAALVAGAVGALPAPANAASADLVLRLFASAEVAYVGQKVVYTGTVQNRGPDEATGITVTAAAGAALELRGATLDGGTCTTTLPVTCTLASLPRNRTARIRLTVAPTAPGSLTQVVTVASATPEADASTNQASAALEVRPGHAGPPRVNAKGRARASLDARRIDVEVRVGVSEPARFVVGVRDVAARRGVVLQAGTRVGATVLRAPRGSVAIDVPRETTIRLRVVLRRSTLARPRLVLTLRAIDLEGGVTRLEVPVEVARSTR